MTRDIEQLKTDLENAVRRGDELFDQLEKLKKDNESLIEFKLVQIEQLMEEVSKKDEIIKELEEGLDLYANTESWVFSDRQFSDDHDCMGRVDFKEISKGLFKCGKLAREKKKKVEVLRSEL